MKRSLSANVDGQIFCIDEDAYNLLQDYLQQLKATFRGTEGEEIAGDIESRIRELFAEKIASGASVIVIGDVQKVIERMGRPEDLSEDSEYGDAESATTGESSENSERSGNSEHSEASGNAGAAVPPPVGDDARKKYTFSFSLPSNGKKLFRSTTNRVFGGVLGGLAVYTGWNANIMRVLFAALALCSYFFPLLIVYMIAWMIIPEARTPRQRLEMYGQPVNVGTIGQTVISDSGMTPPPVYEEESRNALSSFLQIVGKCTAAVFGLCAGIALFCLFIVVVTGLIGIAAYYLFASPEILEGFNLAGASWAKIAYDICAVLLAILIFAGLFWACFRVIFNSKGRASKSIIISGLVLAFILIVALICLWQFVI